MRNKSQRVTLNVTKEFKDELNKMKRGGESYEEILRREIGGFNSNLENIAEPIAFELKGEYEDLIEYEIKRVYWSSLFKSKVGDSWSVTNNDKCLFRQTAEVIYRDEEVVIVKFKTFANGRGHVEVRSYNFFCEYC